MEEKEESVLARFWWTCSRHSQVLLALPLLPAHGNADDDPLLRSCVSSIVPLTKIFADERIQIIYCHVQSFHSKSPLGDVQSDTSYGWSITLWSCGWYRYGLSPWLSTGRSIHQSTIVVVPAIITIYGFFWDLYFAFDLFQPLSPQFLEQKCCALR